MKKSPPKWYSMKQGKWLRFDELSLEELCIELEFLIWYFRDDPVMQDQWKNDPEQEIIDTFHRNLFRFIRTKKRVPHPLELRKKSHARGGQAAEKTKSSPAVRSKPQVF